MSLHETFPHGDHACFDVAVSLLLLLLIGRTLDHVMRERARQAVNGLARLSTRGAMVLRQDGTQTYLSVDEIAPGMTILLAAGERVPVDGRVLKGRSELDRSLVSGDRAPRRRPSTAKFCPRDRLQSDRDPARHPGRGHAAGRGGGDVGIVGDGGRERVASWSPPRE